MPLSRAEADALQKLPLGDVHQLADRQWARALEGLDQAKSARTAPGAPLTTQIQSSADEAGRVIEQASKLVTAKPAEARALYARAFRAAHDAAELAAIPVNLAKLERDLDERRTLIDGDRWKPYDEQIARVKAYLASGRPGDFGTNATAASIARTVRVSLPQALSEELARNGGSYQLAWSSFEESAVDALAVAGKVVKEAAKVVKGATDSLTFLLFGLAAAGAVWEFSKRRRGR